MNEKKQISEWKLGIVILNYEAYRETEKCIESILAKGMKFEGIVIVDNASKNESVVYLRKKYQHNSQIKIIRSLHNVGFSKGNNLGIKFAKQIWNVEFVLLLNSDTVMLQEDYIERMMQQYQNRVAVIQSNALRINGRYTERTFVSNSSKELWRAVIRGVCDAHDIYKFKKLEKPGDLGPFISGCDFLLTPYFFKAFHGLYPLTFLFQEEPILMIVLKKAGLHSCIAEDAVILHKESMSTPDDLKIGGSKRKKEIYRGSMHMVFIKFIPMWILRKIINHGEW